MPTAVVTGAFGNIGSAVAAELIVRGWSIRTLTNHPVAGGRIPAHPLRFVPDELEQALSGADAFVNTYWVRFPHGGVTFESAVRDCRVLIDAAKSARVARFVQVSVSNASLECPLGYYRGKAEVEHVLRTSSLSYAIVRPTLVVGPKDVLTNNIAWFLRRLPVFPLPAGAGYRLQPVLIPDAARIIADAVERREAVEVDAAGPEIVTFADYVRRLAAAIHAHPAIVALPPGIVLGGLGLAGAMLRDTVLTREELDGLRADLLVSRAAPLGASDVFAWLREHGGAFGRRYTNDTLPRFSKHDSVISQAQRPRVMIC